MSTSQCTVIAITNQKGGVRKTTTAMNLACALSIAGRRVLAIDSDPHGNLTQGLGVPIQSLRGSIYDLIVQREFPTEAAIIRNPNANGIDLIGANPKLAQAARWMVTQTNSELRLKQRVTGLRGQYDFIIVDSCPGLGTLLNSTLNSADYVLIPVDPGFYGYMGIQELRNEMEEIRSGTNPTLSLLGLVLTFSDRTVITRETQDILVGQFGDQVFSTVIRRCVALRESPAVGKSVFSYLAQSAGTEDYSALAMEVIERLGSAAHARTLEGVAHV